MSSVRPPSNNLGGLTRSMYLDISLRQSSSLAQRSQPQKTAAFQLGWYCGLHYASLYPQTSLDARRHAAAADARALLPTHEEHADFVAGWLAGHQEQVLKHSFLLAYHNQRCQCGHLLRAPVERERGYCLECGIGAALASLDESCALSSNQGQSSPSTQSASGQIVGHEAPG